MVLKNIRDDETVDGDAEVLKDYIKHNGLQLTDIEILDDGRFYVRNNLLDIFFE